MKFPKNAAIKNEMIRMAFLDGVYDLSDDARCELALGLSCLRVCTLNGFWDIVCGTLYLADEYRYEYFGRWDIEQASEVPGDYRALAQACASENRVAYYSAQVLNGIDDHVDRLFPGKYTRSEWM